MSHPIYQCWTKATDAESGSPRHSANWVVARRARFRIFADRVECGGWVIRNAEVQEAVLFEARQLFVPVFILALQTSTRAYQFGFNPWVRVAQYLPFAFRRERLRLGYSPFSIAVRVVLLVYLAFMAWQWLFAGTSP